MTGDGTVTWMNRGSEALLGIDPAEMVGRHALEFIHPEDHDVLVEVMAEDARGSDDRSVSTVRLAHADGKWVAFEFAGLDERQADGSGTYLVWGRPFEYVTRLMAFLDTLLTDIQDDPRNTTRFVVVTALDRMRRTGVLSHGKPGLPAGISGAAATHARSHAVPTARR